MIPGLIILALTANISLAVKIWDRKYVESKIQQRGEPRSCLMLLKVLDWFPASMLLEFPQKPDCSTLWITTCQREVEDLGMTDL